jgi:hypothetical protein
MLTFGPEADEITGIGKTDYLPPSVSENSVERHSTGLDAKNVCGGISLGEDKFLGLYPAQRRRQHFNAAA